MKFRTTAKAIREGSLNPRTVGYCDLHYLLHNHNPIAYTCGIYGWNFDVYEVYGLTICTGYRGMVGKRCEKTREYEDQAREILSHENKAMTYAEKCNGVETLLQEFCKLNGGY